MMQREAGTMRERLKVVVEIEAWSGNRRPWRGRVSWVALDGTERLSLTGYCETEGGAKRKAEAVVASVVAEAMAGTPAARE